MQNIIKNLLLLSYTFNVFVHVLSVLRQIFHSVSNYIVRLNIRLYSHYTHNTIGICMNNFPLAFPESGTIWVSFVVYVFSYIKYGV